VPLSYINACSRTPHTGAAACTAVSVSCSWSWQETTMHWNRFANSVCGAHSMFLVCSQEMKNGLREHAERQTISLDALGEASPSGAQRDSFSTDPGRPGKRFWFQRLSAGKALHGCRRTRSNQKHGAERLTSKPDGAAQLDLCPDSSKVERCGRHVAYKEATCRRRVLTRHATHRAEQRGMPCTLHAVRTGASREVTRASRGRRP
jgi:hypothetical protein